MPSRMVLHLRSRAVSILLVLGSYALALAQRPGEVIADTKVHLYIDPARFLTDVASAWTPTADLGHVWAGQYGGYLFPMAPFFAAGDALGLPVWIVHRLWLGSLFAVAALGVAALARALIAGERSGRQAPLLLVASGLYVVNPYVAVYANRTSVALLAYAALPWLLLCVHRGLRDPRGWWWPAAFALVMTCTGGGVNAAVSAWMLLAPALLLLYELGPGGIGRSALLPWLSRMFLVSVLANAWWVIPLVVHAANGVDFLPFTEQPGTIWGTSSIAESLRLMGFWTSYIGVGYGGALRPYAGHGPAVLFSVPVVLAGMIVPGLAILGLRWTWRERYAPLFGLMIVAGVVAMAAGFPNGTPLRRGLTFTYNHFEAIRFLRTSYKAGPLVALGVAVLGGLAFARAWSALSRHRSSRGPMARAPRAALTFAAVGLIALAAWPLSSGRAPDRQLAFKVPSWWKDAARTLDRADPNTRALLLPGQLFASYDWGQTIDPILPVLTKHPVASRYIVPFSDLRSTELQWAVDALIGQERLLPGQLAPLLDLMGVGQVVVATDGDRTRGGELGPAEVARALGRQPYATGAAQSLGDDGLGAGGEAAPAKARDFGPRRRLAPAPDRVASAIRRAPVQLRPARTGGIVRIVPRGPLTVLDGGAQGILGLAAFGDLRPGLPLAYAPDLDRERITAATRQGAGFVIADGVRRRAFVAARLRGNTGATLPADRDLSEDGTRLNPFRDLGPDDPRAQTVAQLRGIGASHVSAPLSPQVTQFPEHRPSAALDGDLRTAWLADRVLPRPRHHLDIEFWRPRDVDVIALYPYSDARAVVRAVAVNGRRYRVHRGWNRLRVGLRHVSALRVAIAQVDGARKAAGGAGGIREIGIGRVRLREVLRPPTLLEDELRGEDLGSSPLTYLLSRTTADAPNLRGRLAPAVQAGLLRDARDPELRLRRSLRPPAARRFIAEAWVSVDPQSADDELDRLVDPAAAVFSARSSSRLEGRPRYRASAAFDGRRSRGWIGQWLPGRHAWLAWTAPRRMALSRVVIVAPTVRVRRPTRVRLRSDQGVSKPAVVGRDGVVRFSRPQVGRRFRLEILDAAFPPGTPAALRSRRAVGIAELGGTGVAAVRARRRGHLAVGCGAVTLSAASHAVSLRLPTQDLRRFDAGLPMRAEGCGALSLPAARVVLRDDGASVFRADHLRLFSAPPSGVSLPGAGGRVLDAGKPGNGSRSSVRVAVDGPSWLVYGESYAAGWRARCDGRDLGAPTPMQGFANAWPLEPGCERVEIGFAPDRALQVGYAISVVAVLALIALLFARRRPPGRPRLGPLVQSADRPERWRWNRALLAAAGAGTVLGFMLSLRAGLVIVPLVALVLWRGVRPSALVTVAGTLAVVGVPVAHFAARPIDRGGYDTNFAVEHIAAHWLATAAITLVLVALVCWLREDRRLDQ